MKVLILENEGMPSLESSLLQTEYHTNVIAKINSVQGATSWLKNHRPDLIFMEIELSDGLCFPIFESVKLETPIIFLANHPKYTNQVTDYNCIDYIQRPYSTTIIELALGNVHRWIEYNKHNDKQLKSFGQLLDNQMNKVKKISFPIVDGLEFLAINEIMQCSANGSYTDIYLKNGSKICVTKKIIEVEQMLQKFPFYRVHRSFLVNVNFVKSYKRSEGKSYVILENGSELPVSRRKKEDFLQYLSTF